MHLTPISSHFPWSINANLGDESDHLNLIYYKQKREVRLHEYGGVIKVCPWVVKLGRVSEFPNFEHSL